MAQIRETLQHPAEPSDATGCCAGTDCTHRGAEPFAPAPARRPIDALAGRPLEALVAHLLATHHAYTRAQLAALDDALDDVLAGPAGARLARLAELITQVSDDLLSHLMKEERMLFPYVTALAQAAATGGPAPRAPFGTVANPARVMAGEHVAAEGLMRALRAEVARLRVDAPPALAALCAACDALDRDLAAHMALEEDVLFPCAAALEAQLRGAATDPTTTPRPQ